MSARGRVHGRRAPPEHRFRFWPATRLGWLVLALAVASVALTLGWKLMSPAGAVPGLSCGFAGGVAGLAAIFAVKDRSVTVVASVAPFIFAVIFVLAEHYRTLPARVRGGWQKGVRHKDREYLPLTPAVLASHLRGRCTSGCTRAGCC